MLPIVWRFWNRLRSRAAAPSRRPAGGRRNVKLELVCLEERTVPAVGLTGTIAGVVFADPLHTGNFQSSSALLSGFPVTLSGTTDQGAAVNASATATGGGAFDFNNVLPGTYHLSVGTAAGFLGNGATPDFHIDGGATVTENVGFVGGLDPNSISLRQFLSTTAASDFHLPKGGSGQGTANSRANHAPTVSATLGDVTVPVGTAAAHIDLAGFFSDPDFTNSQVTFHITNGGIPESLKLNLFDTTAPKTVANFFDYVNSGRYDNALFTRLVSGFVLQGGGLALNSAGNGLTAVSQNPAIPNEFGASNTLGTLAMALSGGNANSGTDQFFINLSNNSATLDAQKFTVFGHLADAAATSTLFALASTGTKDESGSSAASSFPSVDLKNVPLTNYSGTKFPADATANNYMLINSISVDKRDEFLTYSVTSSDPSVVNASVTDEWLNLNYSATHAGTTTVTVTATDSFGATVSQSFNVTTTLGAPTVNSVTLAPDSATNVTTLTATPSATDPQNQTVTYAYQWMQNGTPVSGATAATLDLAVLTVLPADQFTVAVTPSDSLATGATFTSSAAVVAGTHPTTLRPPVVQSVTITAGATAVNSSVTSGDPATLSYQWLKNGQPIANQTSPSLSLSNLGVAVGDAITLDVTPSMGVLAWALVTSNALTVTGTNPITFA
jgi:cyclophilin family peptidyl-prolyl cis-trans isomerase